MTYIKLDATGIERALPRLSMPLPKYAWLQAELRRRDVSRDHEYQVTFNGFYRVRRNAGWRDVFYTTLEQAKEGRPTFAKILETLYASTSRIEASFTSKLVATVDPTQPVIDSIVLGNLRLTLPSAGEASRRIQRVVDLHASLIRYFTEYLNSTNGRYLVARFREIYPETRVTEVKMLDLVLWQTRGAA